LSELHAGPIRRLAIPRAMPARHRRLVHRDRWWILHPRLPAQAQKNQAQENLALSW